MIMATLQRKLQAITDRFDGRVGIGVQTATQRIAIHSGERFSLQSVMKMVVAAAVMNGVDHERWRLADTVLVRRTDLSLNVQPIADLVHQSKTGYRTTIADLVRRAVVDSDSAATDILFARVGGKAGIATFFARVGITGMRIDRDERHLQTETVGLTWRPEYVDADVLDRAKKAVPDSVRGKAFEAYLHDPRDTSTPEAMASFLFQLASGKLLSPESTRHLLGVMRQTAIGPHRLKAGLAPGWTLAHKTGTSVSFHGVTAASNDVGVLTAPNGRSIALAVFVAESRRSEVERDAVIAAVARAVCAYG